MEHILCRVATAFFPEGLLLVVVVFLGGRCDFVNLQ